MCFLAAQCTKEDAAAGITAIFGKDITDTILRTSDGPDQRGRDEYSPNPLMKAVINGADRSATKDIHKQFGALVAIQFDFRQKILTNVE